MSPDSLAAPRKPSDVVGGLLRLGAVVLFCFTVALLPFLDPTEILLSPSILLQSILVFIGTFAVRPGRYHPVSIGGTLLVGLELLRGVVVPLLIQVVGQDSPLYRSLGTFEDAATVLYIGNLFLLGFVVARFIGASGRVSASPLAAEQTLWLSRSASIWLILIGLVATIIRFPTLESIQGFLNGNYEDLVASASSGVLAFSSSVLRPLLPLGIAQLLVQRRERGRPHSILLWIALVTSVFFALGSYGLNRAAIILPIAAYFIAYMTYFKMRLRPIHVVMGLGTIALAFVWLGSVRQSLFADRIGASGQPTNVLRDAIQTILIYGQSPLQSAPAIAADRLNSDLWSLETFFRSAISPIPGIPDALRSGSGTAIYNEVLYGGGGTRDQILTVSMEAALSLGLLGALIVGMLAGVATNWVDRRIPKSQDFVTLYAYTMGGLVIGQMSISSLTATGQSLIYFVLIPILCGLLLRSVAKTLSKSKSRELE